jgi:hypothetical protein
LIGKNIGTIPIFIFVLSFAIFLRFSSNKVMQKTKSLYAVKFIVIFSLMVMTLNGCTNPFITREIEDPEIGDNSAIYDPPVSSDIVLSNFRFAIIQENISNYMNCFVDPSLAYNFVFRFVPDPAVETDKFRLWTLYDEESYLNTVFKQSVNISLEFFDRITYTNISQSPDSVQTNSFRYELRIVFEDEDAIFVGTARMKLIKDINALWHIYYWEDTKSEDLELNSWTNLKATFKN